MNSKNMAICALVFGILGIVGGYLPVVQYFTLVLAILGIVFGAKSRKECADEDRGIATAGLVLGIIGTVINASGVVCGTCFGGIACATACTLCALG